jgi:hypothetical protein
MQQSIRFARFDSHCQSSARISHDNTTTNRPNVKDVEDYFFAFLQINQIISLEGVGIAQSVQRLVTD